MGRRTGAEHTDRAAWRAKYSSLAVTSVDVQHGAPAVDHAAMEVVGADLGVDHASGDQPGLDPSRPDMISWVLRRPSTWAGLDAMSSLPVRDVHVGALAGQGQCRREGGQAGADDRHVDIPLDLSPGHGPDPGNGVEPAGGDLHVAPLSGQSLTVVDNTYIVDNRQESVQRASPERD